jgi:endonuclease/exonuclease/phosphatase family metal-dependent hydrolase
MKIKILSWNIWCDSYFDKVKEFLLAANAPIIALQEVSLEDKERDVVSFLKDLGYEYVSAPSAEFTAFGTNKHHKLHSAVFSKFPIIESKSFVLNTEGNRGAIEAKIKVGEKVLTVFSIHLKHTHHERTELQDNQARTVASLLPPTLGIVMGDFNALPDSYPIQLMEEKYVNTDKTNAPTWSMYIEGCGVCKNDKLDTRLDYIFVSPDIKFSSFEVGMSKGSDHLPVSIEIEL